MSVQCLGAAIGRLNANDAEARANEAERHLAGSLSFRTHLISTMKVINMQTSGLNHVILTVSDSTRAREFYGGVLGFEVKDIQDGFYFVSGDVDFFFFPSSKPQPNDRFNEFRIGLDHLAFTAPSEIALNALANRLIASGVDTKGVEIYVTGNKYVAFRDPDNIQLEYWLPGHTG